MTGPDLIPVVLAENCDRRQWVGNGCSHPSTLGVTSKLLLTGALSPLYLDHLFQVIRINHELGVYSLHLSNQLFIVRVADERLVANSRTQQPEP